MQPMTLQAKISNVKLELDRSTGRFVAFVTIVAGANEEYSWCLECNLADNISNQRLSRLMDFVESHFFKDLTGSSIRVICFRNRLLAFGSDKEDVFIPLVKNMFVERTEGKIISILNGLFANT